MQIFTFLNRFGLYTNASLVKLLIWGLVLVLTLLTLNVKEDPEVALSFLLIWVFVFSRGLSYFLFYGWELLILLWVSQEKMQKDAYKASFLFGLYALINVLLLIGGWRNKGVGIILFFIFIALQAFLFTPKPLSWWQSQL